MTAAHWGIPPEELAENKVVGPGPVLDIMLKSQKRVKWALRKAMNGGVRHQRRNQQNLNLPED